MALQYRRTAERLWRARRTSCRRPRVSHGRAVHGRRCVRLGHDVARALGRQPRSSEEPRGVYRAYRSTSSVQKALKDKARHGRASQAEAHSLGLRSIGARRRNWQPLAPMRRGPAAPAGALQPEGGFEMQETQTRGRVHRHDGRAYRHPHGRRQQRGFSRSPARTGGARRLRSRRRRPRYAGRSELANKVREGRIDQLRNWHPDVLNSLS